MPHPWIPRSACCAKPRSTCMRVNMGATAIGTGSMRRRDMRKAVRRQLANLTGKPIVPATDMIAATWDQAGFVAYSAALKSTADQTVEDCERLDPAGFWAARRSWRDRPAGVAARFVDHAGQGQSGHSRTRKPRCLPRDGKRRRRRLWPPIPVSLNSTPMSRSKGWRSWSRSNCCTTHSKLSAPSAWMASPSTRRRSHTTWKRRWASSRL